MKDERLEMDTEETKSESVKIDFKRVAYRLLKFWYLVVFSVTLGWTYAYLKNRYAVRIYSVTASLIIHETQESNEADILYSNSIIDAYRNYLNEPYIIRSYPLISKVIENLNFEVAFYQKGNIKSTELYNLPVKARLLKKNGSYGASLLFKALNDKSFLIKSPGQEKDAGKIFQFNDSIEYHGHHFALLKDSNRSIEEIKNLELVITFLNPLDVTASYLGRLGVSWAEKGAGILNLSIAGSTPDKESDFMMGLISTYQQYDLDKKNLRADRTIQFIKHQLVEIADSLKKYENKLDQLKNSSDKLEGESERLFDELKTLEEQKTEFTIKSMYYDYLVKTIKQGNNLDLIILPSAMGITDGVLSSLVTKMLDLQFELKMFMGKGKDENPMVKGALDRLEGLKTEMIETVSTLRATDKIKSDFLESQLAKLERQINLLPLEQRRLVSLKRNYNVLESLYVFLMQKMSEAGISKASNSSDIVMVNPPMKGGPIYPNTSQNYSFGVTVGLLFPIVIFTLLEFLNRKIQSKEDIDKLTTIPFIGGIGHYEIEGNLAVSARPRSSVAESFRAVRSNLNYFTGNQLKKVFLVNSSISGEGKTFCTINLATVFGMSGRKTLIIGADLRKPKIYDDLSLENTRGLSGYLSQLNSFTEVIQHSSIENVDLISGGPVPPNPSELLLTDRFETLIKEALAEYDYIIIDSPPLAIVTDAFVLSKYADHTIFVTRQNFTPKSFLHDIQEFYNSGKLKNLSIVLNDIYKSGLGYGYGYGYSYGYGYGYVTKNHGKGYYS